MFQAFKPHDEGQQVEPRGHAVLARIKHRFVQYIVPILTPIQTIKTGAGLALSRRPNSPPAQSPASLRDSPLQCIRGR